VSPGPLMKYFEINLLKAAQQFKIGNKFYINFPVLENKKKYTNIKSNIKVI